MINLKKDSPTWRLKSIKIEFKNGYSFENTVDRYEGKIMFGNDKSENITMNIEPHMAEKYIKLCAEDIKKHAAELSNRLLLSLNVK